MKLYLLVFSLLCLLTSGRTDASEKPVPPGEPDTGGLKEKTDLTPEAVKSLFEKLEKGMSKDDVERITGVRGQAKENNALHEQVYYYDYDKSYLYLIYSFDLEKKKLSVSEKQHVIDHLTIEQRIEKRREAFGRWVQQRREIMRKKKELEEKAGKKTEESSHKDPDAPSDR